ncbi:MAG: HlyD family secretion protein [Pseudolabrys sp.]|jgi:HlyD family secretion protein
MTFSRFTLFSFVAAALALAGCDDNKIRMAQGWVEADLIFVSPDETGRVEALSVREGDAVGKGAPLFTVDDDLQQADLVVRKAAVTNAQQTFDRARELLKTAAGTQKTYDDAEAALRQANANLASSQTRLTRRRVFSPVTGTIEQVYYRAGEMVPAGKPVVAILPPPNLKIRFFVPETVLSDIKLGTSVGVSCDGCEKGLTAKVSFIARSAEFTPPVIYSVDERAKLVFMVEARPEQPDKFRVGQPISVTLPDKAAPKEAAK